MYNVLCSFYGRAWTSKMIGALAQLGERVAGSHEVRGSSPLCSTTKCPKTPVKQGFSCVRSLHKQDLKAKNHPLHPQAAINLCAPTRLIALLML